MTSDSNSPPKGQESNGNDLETDSGNGTTRRRLIGGAAALATIPTGASAASSDEVTQQRDNDVQHRHETVDGVWSSVEYLGQQVDDDTQITTTGYHYDDKEGEVEVSITALTVGLHLSFDPDRARAVAHSLLNAAAEAESGSKGGNQ